MSIQIVSNHNELNEHSQNLKDDFILKVMKEEFGYVTAHASLARILYWYEIHGRNIIRL